MSQFPAQVAIGQTTQAARRNLPVDLPVGTGIPSVQPANIGAPGIPGVAVLPAPVPDFSAARDLEQALRATNALGQTLVDVGNALNIQRQIDDRRALTQSRLASEKALAQMTLDFQAGKLNAAIDATDDIEAFKESWSNRWLDPRRSEPPQPGDTMTSAEADYRERISSMAQQMYVKRRGELQQQQFAEDIRGVHVGLIDPTAVGPQPDAETLWGEFSQRYPWLDRATFMEASYGKALEALATAGDRSTFEQVAGGITSDRDRLIHVEPLVDKLSRSAAANVSQRLQAANLALKEASESTAPFASRWATLNDRLSMLVDDEGMRENVTVDFLAQEIANGTNAEQMNAVEAIAQERLSDEGKVEFARRKGALMKPVVTKVLKAQAAVASEDYLQIRADAAGIVDADDLATADRAYVSSVRNARKEATVRTYAKDRDRGEMERLIDEAYTRWDPSKGDVEQARDAVGPDELLDLFAALDEVDKANATTNLVDDVMTRRRVLAPTAAEWDSVAARTGAIRNGRLADPAAAALVVQQTQTMPAKMLDAVYADLRSPARDDVKRGVTFLAAVAPSLADPMIASRINGFTIREGDTAANAATVQAINSTMPLLATLRRGEDGSMSDQDLSTMTDAFTATLKSWQEAQPPAYDARRFEDQLRAANVGNVLGISTTDSQTNTVSVNSFRNAVKTASANLMSKAGLDPTAAAELSDIASARVLRDSVPAIGNAGLSKEVIEQRVMDQAAILQAEFHLPRIGGRGFASPVARTWASRANWDEAAATARLEEMNIRPGSVTHVMPAIGEGNTWWITVEERGRGRNAPPLRKFVQIDLGLPEQEQDLSVDDRIQRALEQSRQRRRAVTGGSGGIAPRMIVAP